MINAKFMTANDAQVLDKKLRDYGNHNDFVAPRELTVTITLSEYRNLVLAKGMNDKIIENLRNKNYELEQKVQTLIHKPYKDADSTTEYPQEGVNE